MNILNSNWARRRWLDFRNGHSIYLIFAMTFANFVTIQYKLLINQVPWLSGLFGSIWVFAIVFVLTYVPIGILLGYWHRKSQWTVEQEALFRENKVGAVMWLYVIESDRRKRKRRRQETNERCTVAYYKRNN